MLPRQEKRVLPRQTWSKVFDFALNLFGMSIGPGNVWRFPYLCYKNGGGVFLIAYFTLLVLVVIPMIILEVSIGQYTAVSVVKAWKLLPVMRGIGYSGPVIMFFCNVYYPVLLAWALRWFVAGFSTDMPWLKCNNTWNTENCIPLAADNLKENFSSVVTNSAFLNNNNSQTINSSLLDSSSVEEFWREKILDISSSIEDSGGVKWDIFACLLVIWILIYFAVWKGIGWTSKVVYVTATLPLGMMIVVLVRGVTLNGAMKGISVYLQPNITKLMEVEVWTDAASQLMFSFRVGCGGLTTLSSHNEFHHNLIRDALIFCAANAGTSFVSGFAIFSVLGFLADVKNTTVDKVAESGPGLVFVAYPTALSFLPWPNFWTVTFFLMVVLLGFDSQFVLQEAFLECTKDLWPHLYKHKWSSEIAHAIIAFIMFVLGISMVTRGGMYVLHIFNIFSAAGWCIYFIVACETISIAWIYGHRKWLKNMTRMLGSVPRIALIISWKFNIPLIAMALMFYSLYSYKPLTYDKTYLFPLWSNVFGWLTALSSMLWIPGTAIYVIWKTPGSSFKKKLRNSTKSKLEEDMISVRKSVDVEDTEKQPNTSI
uniref:sodium- and chloride-dependent GABA transporter 2-like n=1 Tax=Styela clava TaxID=7725 RepID=UPI00193A8ED1|nr:sodium- and chloride-dependent GABA transporter 2-like [Styela clava]